MDRYFEALGARRVYEVARRLDANVSPTQIGEGFSDYLQQRANLARIPAERESVALEGTELLRQYNLNGFSNGMAQIAILAAHGDDIELRDFAARWYAAQKTRVKPLDSPDKVEWYDTAQSEWVMQVGAALGRDDATKYRDIWLTQIDRPNNKYIEQYLPEWGETLWSANPSWFDEIVGTWPVPQQMRAVVGALKVEGNPGRAKALLARLEKLTSDPAVAAADGAPSNSMSPISKSVQSLYQGRTNFARSMALVDAPAALDALDQVRQVIQSGEVYEIAANIARQAVADGQSEIARPFDADLAAQLMEVARKNALTNFSGVDPTGWSDVSAYAVALRDSDAGVGRLMLEDQWAKRQQTPQSNKLFEKEYGHQMLIKAQEKLAWAMAFYDVSRALQWLSEIKDDRDEGNNGLERTHLAILVAALTPPERRSFLLAATFFN
ncbi:hypothetical protein EON80_22170 [bacterium]|nr:MAG: hypothetical protein EON80_22170 [bacterium]